MNQSLLLAASRFYVYCSRICDPKKVEKLVKKINSECTQFSDFSDEEKIRAGELAQRVIDVLNAREKTNAGH